MRTKCEWLGRILVVAVLAGIVGSTGCGGKSDGGGDGPQATSTAGQAETTAAEHGDWWCAEHGVPEEECSVCSTSAAARFKEKGDWCEEHDRARSQCFKCDPSRAEHYVKLYEAKFGKKPPKPTD